MAQLEVRILRRLLFDHLKPDKFEGDNPYLVSLGDTKYWIYLKNLSPAYFKNPDVWRAQLPIRDAFNDCKSSSYPFILLGYDDDNDVYSTWNPNFTKQRLNEAESVSFYSRLSLQQEVGESQEILELMLQNDIKVICFPRSKVLDIVKSIDSFFVNDSKEYVAIGSKRRTDANSSYREFTNTQNIEPFFHYLMDEKGYSDKTAVNYSQAIKRLITKGVFANYHTLFLKYDTIADYHKAFVEFFAKEDVHLLNQNSRKIYSNAFMRYLDFLCDKLGISSESEVMEDETINEDFDWETAYTDSSGKLTKIANPKLLELLRPILDTDYPSTNAALNIIYEFYSDKFSQEVMELKDWMALLKDINWVDSEQKPAMETSSHSAQGGKEYILVVTYPDGTVLKNSNSTTTFLQVIDNSFPDLIMEMKIMVNGVNLISTSKIKPRLKEISNGFFVDVNYKTVKKAEILKQISDELELGLTIELVPYSTEVSAETSPVISSSSIISDAQTPDRQKIKVTLPNGDVLFNNAVVDTYCDAIKFIGYENVVKANMYVGGRPIISRFNCPDSDKYKVVDDGYFLHVKTSTIRKFGILSQLNDRYSIGLKIEYCTAEQVAIPSATQENEDDEKISSIILNMDSNPNTSFKDIVRVTFPDGTVICHNNVGETIVDVIKLIGPRKVQQLKLTAHNSTSGEPLISDTVDPRYEVQTKPVGEGLYVFTCTSTKNKYKSIKRISEMLSLGLKIDYLPGVNKKKIPKVREEINSESKVITYDNSSFLASIRQFELLFSNIRTARNAPHKPILLITIIDLIANHRIDSNIVEYNDALETAFSNTWRRFGLAGSEFECSAVSPFYYMNNEPFWSFKMRIPIGFAGKPTANQLIESGAYAIIPKELVELSKNIAVKERLKKILIDKLKKLGRCGTAAALS